MKTAKVLIVYELVPDSTEFYVGDADEGALAKLKLCHGKFVNQTNLSEKEEAALTWLDTELKNKTESNFGDVAPDQQFHKFISDRPIDLEGLDLLIHTGFIL